MFFGVRGEEGKTHLAERLTLHYITIIDTHYGTTVKPYLGAGRLAKEGGGERTSTGLNE